jgi:hypothetical protein
MTMLSLSVMTTTHDCVASFKKMKSVNKVMPAQLKGPTYACKRAEDFRGMTFFRFCENGTTHKSTRTLLLTIL